jgi:O-antigen/teichoic acid export membrane protein
VIPAFVAAKATGIFASWAAPAVLTALGSVMLLGRLNRGYSFFLRGAGRSIRSLGRSIAANHVITATNLIAITVLPIVVAALVSATQSAYYYTAWRVGAVFFMISPAVAASLFAEGSHDAATLPRQTRSAAKVMTALLVPAVLAAILLGRFVLGIFGPGYADNGYAPLVILAASAAPDAATNLYIAVLRVQNRMGMAVAVNVLIAVVTFGLAAVLVPRFGADGAAWAWLGAQLAGCVLAAADQWLITPNPRVAQ